MLLKYLLPIALSFNVCISFAQNTWPREIALPNTGIVTMYQPQPENYSGNKLTVRAAVSVKKTAKADPVFGAIFGNAVLEADKDTRIAVLENIVITDAKFPSVDNQQEVEQLKQLLSKEIPKWELKISLDQLITTLDEQKQQSDNFNNNPPQIIYTTTPSTLVTIDGDPIIKKDDQLKMDKVVNTPFLIIKNPDDKLFYLYGGKYWYKSSSVTEGWTHVYPSSLSKSIKPINEQIKKNEKEQAKATADKSNEPSSPSAVIVATKPTELIQSKEKADFATIEGTELLYVKNSEDNIFMHISSQKYYVLLGGRWFTASILTGPWSYIAADKIPADFAKIPEGSVKDEVLASVPGTDAAAEARLDASIPQTAKVDRKTATVNVTYDGSPKFENITGTNLSVAENSSVTVLKSGNKYYCVENGVWFVADAATGPWAVSTERPAEVDKIPPDNQAYNTKYVYVYDESPEYVYVGYTPGYLGSYIYGPTVVYGTGFYYTPWYGAAYYPRPATWGFSMHYNPWMGFSMGFGFSTGWLNFGIGFGGYGGGWFGPPMYRPPYRPYGGGYGGYYGHGGRGPIMAGHNTNININHTNNIYNHRGDVKTKDINKYGGRHKTNGSGRADAGKGGDRVNRAGGKMNADRTDARPSNNIVTDKDGNVFRKDDKGDWQQNDKKDWKSVDNNSKVKDLNRTNTQRERGQARAGNFDRARPATTAPARSMPSRSMPARPAGGGRRR